MSQLLSLLHSYQLTADVIAFPYASVYPPCYLLRSVHTYPVDLWIQLRTHVAQTGYWPLILGAPERLEDLRAQRFPTSASAMDILRTAQEIDPLQELLSLENHQRRAVRTALRDYALPFTRPDLTTYPTDAELAHYTDLYYRLLEADLGEVSGTRGSDGEWWSERVDLPADRVLLADEPTAALLLLPIATPWESIAVLGWQTVSMPAAVLIARAATFPGYDGQQRG